MKKLKKSLIESVILERKINRTFIVHPGIVISKKDGEEHFVSFMELVHLYGVNQKECINAEFLHNISFREEKNVIHLYPNYGGNYKQWWNK